MSHEANTDINKFILNEGPSQRDEEALMEGLGEWSEAQAREVAEEESITLTDAHWDVVNFLRDRYRREGQAKSARFVSEALEERYADQGGLRYLYQLFPQGPVNQGTRIAGLPLPPYTRSASFGSAS